MSDQYQTLAKASEALYKEKGSKFLAYAFPVRDEQSIQEALAHVQSLHPKARHHCYAWRIGFDGNAFRANDDGEPSGTAGRPILGQIDSFELTNVLVVVVRYFGGTLLGASGLIRAYKESTKMALQVAEIEQKWITKSLEIKFEYRLMSNVMNAIKRLKLEMTSQNFNENPSVTVAINRSEVPDKLLYLKMYIGELHKEQAMETETVEGIEFVEK